jgi:hypothetical protein
MCFGGGATFMFFLFVFTTYPPKFLQKSWNQSHNISYMPNTMAQRALFLTRGDGRYRWRIREPWLLRNNLEWALNPAIQGHLVIECPRLSSNATECLDHCRPWSNDYFVSGVTWLSHTAAVEQHSRRFTITIAPVTATGGTDLVASTATS